VNKIEYGYMNLLKLIIDTLVMAFKQVQEKK
jgi:hypothetical protein